jgi:DNA-directed RNA polymerase subunit RPC12/RpoP
MANTRHRLAKETWWAAEDVLPKGGAPCGECGKTLVFGRNERQQIAKHGLEADCPCGARIIVEPNRPDTGGRNVSDHIRWAKCPECGAEQEDMGRNVACDECGYGPMPFQDPDTEPDDDDSTLRQGAKP